MLSAEKYILNFVGGRSERIEKATDTLTRLVAFHDKCGKNTPKKLEKMERVKGLLIEVKKL
jgi:hypothetical protein